MTSFNEIAKSLSKYGITYNEARVYIAAAKLGTSSVNQISKTSQVAREEVYRLISKLEDFGLVEKTVERPTKIKAMDLKPALKTLVSRKKEILLKQISNLEDKRNTIIDDFYKLKMGSKTDEETHLTIIKQKHAIHQKLISMIDDAKKTVCISITRHKFLKIIADCRVAIIKALRRDVQFCIVLEKDEYYSIAVNAVKEFESYGIIDIRFVDQIQSHYILLDYEKALLTISIQQIGFGYTPKMWTDDGNLIRLLKENFEVMWLISQQIEDVKNETRDEKLRSYLSNLQPTEHTVLIYKTLEAKNSVLSNFIKVGLEKGEATIYVCSEENQLDVRNGLKHSGIEVEKYENADALKILGFNEFYIINGKFSTKTTIEIIKQLYDDALGKGFRGCRVFGEMSCFFQHNLNKELIEYERALDRTFDFPIIGMCAYNAEIFDNTDFPAEEYKKLLKTHSKVLFMEQDMQLEKFEIR